MTCVPSFFNNETELKNIDHENTDHLFLRRVDIWLDVQRGRAGQYTKKIMSSSTTEGQSPLYEELLSRSTSSAAGEAFLYAFIVFIGTVGNFAVLLVLYKNHRLRNIPAYFVISLAISDIVMLDLCAPFSIAVLMMGHWMFGNVLCQIQGFVVMWVACASLGTLALVAINR